MRYYAAAKAAGGPLEYAAAGVMLLVMGGFFVIPEWSHRLVFYVGCVALLVYALDRRVWRHLVDEPLLLLGALYVLYLFAVSLVLSGAALDPAFSLFRKGLLVLLFNLTLYELVRRRALSIDLLFGIFALSAALSCLAALALFLLQTWNVVEVFDSGRLVGFGRANHPVLGGVLAGTALIYFFAPPAPARFATRAMQALRWLAILILVAFAVLTGSRTALVALGAALTFLFVVKRRWLPLVVLLAGAAAVAIAYVAYGVELGELISRGDSHRLAIWRNALQAIGVRPLFGHGLAANAGFAGGDGNVYKSAHNLVLNALYQGGALGLFLLLLTYGLIAARWRLARSPAVDFLSVLLVYGFISAQFDFYSLLTNLNVEWVIYWIPIVLFAAASRTPPAESARRPPPDMQEPSPN